MHRLSDMTATYCACCSISGSLSNLKNLVREAIHGQLTQLSVKERDPELAGEQTRVGWRAT